MSEQFPVTFELEGGPSTITVGADEFILAAARRAGLVLPSLCEQGWCITCAVWVLTGVIDQTASRRFYEQDRQAGFGLICTGRPRSTLHLRPGATEAMRVHRIAQRLPAPRGTSSRIFPGRSKEAT
ncbi:MAG TPA: 2Fe-2S iron-sulfur cluster-binding protein [Chloroflexota bacterium]